MSIEERLTRLSQISEGSFGDGDTNSVRSISINRSRNQSRGRKIRAHSLMSSSA